MTLPDAAARRALSSCRLRVILLWLLGDLDMFMDVRIGRMLCYRACLHPLDSSLGSEHSQEEQCLGVPLTSPNRVDEEPHSKERRAPEFMSPSPSSNRPPPRRGVTSPQHNATGSPCLPDRRNASGA